MRRILLPYCMLLLLSGGRAADADAPSPEYASGSESGSGDEPMPSPMPSPAPELTSSVASFASKTCGEVKKLYQDAACCGGDPNTVVDLGVESTCQWEESEIPTDLPAFVTARPGISHTLDDGRTIYLQTVMGMTSEANGLVIAWDFTQPNSLLWVANITDNLLVDLGPYGFGLQNFFIYYWLHSNGQPPYVWNNTVYTTSFSFPWAPSFIAALDLYTGRVLKVAPAHPKVITGFDGPRGSVHVIESGSESTVVLQALPLNYQMFNGVDNYTHPLEGLKQDLSDKRYMHGYGPATNPVIGPYFGGPLPAVNLEDSGCGKLFGLDPVTLAHKWTVETCAPPYKVGDTLGADAFAPGVTEHIVDHRLTEGYVFETTATSSTVGTQTFWHKVLLKDVQIVVPEGFVWPADSATIATVADGDVSVGDLRKWVVKKLKIGYTFPATEDGATEAAWVSEAGGSFWRSNAINIPYKGETVGVFTSGNGVNIPEANAKIYTDNCESMPVSLTRFAWDGYPFEDAKKHFVDQVKCRLGVWKTKSSPRERRNYNNGHIGVYANGTIAFGARDEAYDSWDGGHDPGKSIVGNPDGSLSRVRDAVDCDPIPPHYFVDMGTPYLVWGSKCGIRHKFNLDTLESDIITMEGYPGRTNGNHFSDVLVQTPGKDPILVAIYENIRSGSQMEVKSAPWIEWTNLTLAEGDYALGVGRQFTFRNLPQWEGITRHYMVGTDPRTLERKWITPMPGHTGDSSFLNGVSFELGAVPIRMTDGVTRIVDAHSGTVLYKESTAVGSYTGWVPINSHLWVGTMGNVHPTTYQASESTSLHVLHYKCEGDDALGAIHQPLMKTIEPMILTDNMSATFHNVLERNPTESDASLTAAISGLPITMARALIADTGEYARKRLHLDVQANLSAKTYLIVGGSSGMGFQTGLFLATMGATVHLLARTQRIYDLNIASALSAASTPAAYPFYGGKRSVSASVASRMHFRVADVRSYASYKAAVNATGTGGEFDGIFITAGAFKIHNSTDKTYATQLGFSSSNAEEIAAFPDRFAGATVASQYPVQVASTRHTAMLMDEGLLTSDNVALVASTAAIFNQLIGFKTTSTFGYVPYTFAKMEQADSAPIYLREQTATRVSVFEPSGLFTGINMAYQAQNAALGLDLGDSAIPSGCEGAWGSFTSDAAQWVLGKWDVEPALFGAFAAKLSTSQLALAASTSPDGCVAYFDNFGVANLLAPMGMTTELEMAQQITKALTSKGLGVTHTRDSGAFAPTVNESFASAYTATRDPIARAVLSQEGRKWRFPGSSDAAVLLEVN